MHYLCKVSNNSGHLHYIGQCVTCRCGVIPVCNASCITEMDRFPLPRIDEHLDCLSEYFTSLDLA